MPKDYDRYLRSGEWNKIREEVLKRDDYKGDFRMNDGRYYVCDRCGLRMPNEVLGVQIPDGKLTFKISTASASEILSDKRSVTNKFIILKRSEEGTEIQCKCGNRLK